MEFEIEKIYKQLISQKQNENKKSAGNRRRKRL